MKISPKILILLLVVAMTSCAPMPVRVDYDKSYDLTNRKTFSLLPNEQNEPFTLGMEKSTIDSIVTKTVNEEFTSKGYRKMPDDPEILVSYYVVTNAKTDFYVVNDYYSHLGYQPPGRSNTRDSFHLQETMYEEGILIIDIIDAVSKQRIWQGFLTSRLDVYKSEERKEQRLHNAVVKILNYVPATNI